MAKPKTARSNGSVTEFIASIDDPGKRADARKIARMMRAATGARARMWGTSIVGYGSYHYQYDSGREGDWMLVGFSPRKQNLTVYIMPGFDRFSGLLKKLGKYKTGKSCLYIKRLEDIDESVLEQLISDSVTVMRSRYEVS